ncbi:MAG: allophanate hydrolase [Lautropia sp.]
MNAPEPHASNAWLARIEPRDPAGEPAEAADGPLAGLRFAVKDNINVAGVPTTAACVGFSHLPRQDATVVARLKAAGAIAIGKTNLDQFACGLNGTRSPYGAVPNAFDPALISGGSSSGSAYVVATGEADFSLGTDTAGSGRVPAALNNIVGLKPTRGLVSANGVVPAARSVDCVSIFAPTVGLACRVLEAAIGFDAADPFSRELALADVPIAQRFRFGVPDDVPFFGDTRQAAAWKRSVEQLRELGGTPVVIDYAPLARAGDLLYGSALLAERHAAIRSFFDAWPGGLIEPVRGIIAEGSRYGGADVFDALTELARLARDARSLWQRIDVLVVPTCPGHLSQAQLLADPVALNRRLGHYTSFVNLLDMAAIAIPTCLREDGLPFGVSLIGPAGSDWQLAGLGQRVHHASGLSQGAGGHPLPPPQPIAGLSQRSQVRVAVVGAHLSGMPLNAQLTERGARLVETTTTSDAYRLYALAGTRPAKPGLLRLGARGGAPITLEVWSMPASAFGGFVALVPPPLAIGSIELADGTWVQGFVCEPSGLEGAEDITHTGGWRAWLAGSGR